MTETLAYGYLSESIQQELSIEYKHDKNLCVLVLWTKVGLNVFQNFLFLERFKPNGLFWGVSVPWGRKGQSDYVRGVRWEIVSM